MIITMHVMPCVSQKSVIFTITEARMTTLRMIVIVVTQMMTPEVAPEMDQEAAVVTRAA